MVQRVFQRTCYGYSNLQLRSFTTQCWSLRNYSLKSTRFSPGDVYDPHRPDLRSQCLINSKANTATIAIGTSLGIVAVILACIVAYILHRRRPAATKQVVAIESPPTSANFLRDQVPYADSRYMHHPRRTMQTIMCLAQVPKWARRIPICLRYDCQWSRRGTYIIWIPVDPIRSS